MCSKTCKISQLFCIICTIIEITNTQPPPPISPFNYRLNDRPQLRNNFIMPNLYGIEQIVPMNNNLPQSIQFFNQQQQQLQQQRYMPNLQTILPTSSFNSMPNLETFNFVNRLKIFLFFSILL